MRRIDFRSTAGGRVSLLAIVLITIPACERAPEHRLQRLPESGAAHPSAALVVDSALPMSQLIERFQRSAGVRPDSLTGGEPALEPLVRRYVAALAAADTAALRALVVTQAEYAYLFFPGSTMARPPYELQPDVAWMMLLLESRKGVERAASFVDAHNLSYAGVQCPEPQRSGAARAWRGCTVRARLPGGSMAQARLFSEIVELRGHHKFLSYANSLPPSTGSD